MSKKTFKEKKTVKDRNKAAVQKKQQEIDMNRPMNKYFNERDEKGGFKHKYAEMLGQYYISNPDPVMDMMQRITSFCDLIRKHKEHYFMFMDLEDDLSKPVNLVDAKGNSIPREELYFHAIQHKNAINVKLSAMRSLLINELLNMVDGDVFTFEKYDIFVSQLITMVKSLGYDLFPRYAEMQEVKNTESKKE